MDLNEQMDVALDALLVEVGTVGEEARRVLRLAWLDGYKRGMEAVQKAAEDAITKALT